MVVRDFCIKPPPEHPSCHAASICELPSGELLACCYAGTREGAPDSVVLGARLDPKKGRWSQPVVWVDVARRAPANPRVFMGPREEVWLLVGVNYGHWCSGDTYLFLKRSYDGGRSFTDLELLVETKGLLGKNKPLRVGDIWLIPVEWERSWSAAFLRSSDGGETWEIVGDLGREAGAHLIQPSVVQLSGGELLAYMRSQEGYIYRSFSFDLGKTWTHPEPTSLPNANSAIDLIRLRSGVLALAYNPTSPREGERPLEDTWPAEMPVNFRVWGPRTPLKLAFSLDEGESWPYEITLEDGPGEFSYPALIQTVDGSLHVVYTYRRQAIAHVVIPEEEIEALLRGGSAWKGDGHGET